ncbi:MAG: transcriptional repressor LexA [Proteobacteria bacterium]|jgi:repressor LexA|nr:transcriptional repressor LexA [Pseudomonadota bacterium]
MTTQQPLPLTEKEKLVLEFIESQLAEVGVSPSYQEIRNHFGFASFNSVQNYLKQLSNKGYIQISENQKRSIQILHSAHTVQTQVKEKKRNESLRESSLLQKEAREEVLQIPLLGKVAAGAPIEAFEHNEYVDVPPSLVRNPNKSFALKVKGQSMIDDGIFDGDLILVQKQSTATNGEIIVASVENESTVKRFYLKPHPDGSARGEKMVELRPANPTMSSMWYHPQQVEIQGVVVGLIRKF